MPVAVRSVSHRPTTGNGDQNGSSTTCPAPAGVQAGDLLVAIVSRSQTSAGTSGFTASGWATAQFFAGSSSPERSPVAVMWKAAGSEPSSYTFTSTGASSNDQFSVHMLALTGANTNNPILAGPNNTDSGSNSSTASAPSLTLPEPGLLVCWFNVLFYTTGSTTFSTPSGMTMRINANADTGVWLQVATATESRNVGSTGVRSATHSGGTQSRSRGISFAIREAITNFPITLRNARSAARASRALLTVYSTLQVSNAHATVSATAPRITFFEPLGEIADLRAGSSASRPTLAVRQPVTLRPARAATRVTRVAVPQTHPLDIADAQSRVEVGAPVLRQHTVLPAIPHGRAATRAGHPTLYAPGAWDARAVSFAQRVQLGQHTPIHVLHAWARARADQLTVTQTHPLDVAAAHASVEVTTPTLTQHAITQVGDARSAAWISGTGPGYGEGGYGEGGYGGVTPGPPLLTQHQPVTVRQVRALVWATRPLVLSGSSMVVHGARSAVHADRPLLATPIVIWPFKARSVSAATRPLLGQNTVLPVLTPARAVSRAELVLVGVRHPLLVAAARAVTAAARTGQLSQHSVLLILDARAVTRGSAVLFRGGAGEHVRTPTTVLVAVRFGTVDQQGRPASVSVDVRSGIHIHEARGAVLETF